MSYIDEQILKAVNEMEKQEVKKLEDGIEIGDITYTFSEQFFFDDRASIMVPDQFIEMPQNLAEIKYPSSQRPKIILTDKETGGYNVTLNLVDSPGADEFMKDLVKGIKNIIKKMQPSNVFYEENIEKINGRNIGWFDYKGPAIDTQIYYYQFFAGVDNQTLFGAVNCPYDEHMVWKPIAKQIMESLKIHSKYGR